MLKTVLKHAVAAAVIVCLAIPMASAQEPVEFKIQLAAPDGTIWNTVERRFAAQLVAATGNRASITFYPPGSITKWPDWLQSTGGGLLDIGFVWHPLKSGKFLQTELFALPGIAKNQTIDSIVYQRLRDTYPQMGELFTEDDNVVELMTFVAMGSHLHTREPVRKLDELKGKVFAVQDATGARTLEALGASASVMVGPDAYLALQRGSVDGVLAGWGWVNNFKFREVVDYHTLLGLNPGSYSYVMNRDTWDRLTEAEQSHIRDLLPTFLFYSGTDSAANVINDVPPENLFTLSADDRSDMMAQMAPLWAEWVEKADAKGWPGQEILDETVRLSNLYYQN